MPEQPSAPPNSDPAAYLVHAVNSSLLEVMFGENSGCLTHLLIDRDAWIINTLYVHYQSDAAPILRTSSTLHKGRIYDDQEAIGRDVLSLDETVPLATSVCGRCILTGRPIWLGDTALALGHDTFADRFYRRFSLVDVNTGGYRTPQAEIVFPVSLRSLGVASTIAVVNLELFSEQPFESSKYFAQIPQESINDFCIGLLQHHAAYLRVAVDMSSLQISSTDQNDVDARLHRESLLQLHRSAMRKYVDQHEEDLQQVKSRLEKVSEIFASK
jgi:hypothetical protein